MSEQRVFDMAFTRTIAREEGRIKSKFESTRFELYNASQFKFRIDGKNFSKKIPLLKSDREEFYLTMFRIRINGRWYEPGGGRYEFFTMDQALKIISDWRNQNEN